MWLSRSCPLLGSGPTAQACALADWESSQRPCSSRAGTHSPEPHQPGQIPGRIFTGAEYIDIFNVDKCSSSKIALLCAAFNKHLFPWQPLLLSRQAVFCYFSVFLLVVKLVFMLRGECVCVCVCV